MKQYSYIPALLQLIAWVPTNILLKLGVFEVKGLEHLDLSHRGYIFASNHVNEIDPVAIRAALPWKAIHTLFYVARAREDYTWSGWRRFVYGDWFFQGWGAYPAYKGTGDYETSLKHHIEFAYDGNHVCIFPEGKLNPEKEKIARGGVMYLAHRTNRMIVPVTLEGTRGFHFFKAIRGGHKITITFGKPKPAMEYLEKIPESADDYKFGAIKLMAEIWTQPIQTTGYNLSTYENA